MRRPASLPHAVMSEIPELFARLGFKAGDRLPPERELAKQLSVGRSSLREAIHGLETMGFVERRQGIGTFFLAEPGAWSTAPLKVHVRSPGTIFEELIETPDSARGAACIARRGEGDSRRPKENPDRSPEASLRRGWRIL